MTTPGARDDVGKASVVTINGAGAMENNDDDAGIAGPLLSAADAIRFSALTARANYLGQDGVDIEFAVKQGRGSPDIGSEAHGLCTHIHCKRSQYA